MPSKSFTGSSAAWSDALDVTNHLCGLMSRLQFGITREKWFTGAHVAIRWHPSRLLSAIALGRELRWPWLLTAALILASAVAAAWSTYCIGCRGGGGF
jgi:hypothetical protein